ncbi:MAG: C2H2-type zinc finger protein [Thermoplasmata archaeon]|nr:C2H2-type zinc finger protein [Thermoplasmata archaeon]
MGESCSVCGAPFGSAAALVEHMKSGHGHDTAAQTLDMNPESHTPGFVCGLCGTRFPTAMALADHNLHRPERRAAEAAKHPPPSPG